MSPLSWIPNEPDLPPEQRGTGPITLRFEDVSQDGRLLLEALPQVLGQIVYAKLLATNAALLDVFKAGILPILSRCVVESLDGPISTARPLQAEGCYQLGHTTGPDGQVDRLILAMWGTLKGTVGRIYGPPPPDAGRPITAGRIYAEHVLTRPFGPPAERKVQHIEIEGAPSVPPARYAWTTTEDALAPPDGATLLDPALVLDPAHTVFGLDHTDSNQHVNSLVYTRLFIEASLRRLASHGKRAPLLAKAAEILYRKPCFAGEQARIAIGAFSAEGFAGARGILITEEEASGPIEAARPRCIARMLFAG